MSSNAKSYHSSWIVLILTFCLICLSHCLPEYYRNERVDSTELSNKYERVQLIYGREFECSGNIYLFSFNPGVDNVPKMEHTFQISLL